jgi:hypothetical protein
MDCQDRIFLGENAEAPLIETISRVQRVISLALQSYAVEFPSTPKRKCLGLSSYKAFRKFPDFYRLIFASFRKQKKNGHAVINFFTWRG